MTNLPGLDQSTDKSSGNGGSNGKNLGKLEKLAWGAGAATGIASRVTSKLWPVRRDSFESYVRNEIKNPYVANILSAIARNQDLYKDNAPITVDESIEILRRDKLAGAIHLLNYIYFVKYCGGGGLKGLLSVPEQYLFHEYGIQPKRYTGESIAAVVEAESSVRGLEDSYGIGTSPQHFEQLAWRLARTLDISAGPGYIPKSLIAAFNLAKGMVRVTLLEAFESQKSLRNILDEEFKGLEMGKFSGLDIIASDMLTGERMIISSDNTYRDMPIAEALTMSTAFPMLYDLVRGNGGLRADGGLHAPPLRLALENGADLIYATVLNRVIEKKSSGKHYFGPWGTVDLAGRIYEIMHRDAIVETFFHLTGKNPDWLASDDGMDPNGMILLSAPDLSNYHSFRLKPEHQKLDEIGRKATLSTFDKLNPTRASEEYVPDLFLRRAQTQRKIGVYVPQT